MHLAYLYISMKTELTITLLRVLPFIIILIVLYLQKKRGKIKNVELALQKPISYSRYMVCTVGFLIFVLLTEFILYTYGLVEATKCNHPLISSIIRIIGAVVLVPVAEELIFRGLLLSKLFNKK